MVKILVPVYAGKNNNRVILHGLRLAHRIGGLVSILEIDPVESCVVDGAVSKLESVPEMKGMQVAQTVEEEVQCEYFRVKGDFYEEVVRFCQEMQITTLVLEIAPASRKASPGSLLEMVNYLQANKLCRVELIGKK